MYIEALTKEADEQVWSIKVCYAIWHALVSLIIFFKEDFRATFNATSDSCQIYFSDRNIRWSSDDLGKRFKV